MDKVKIRKVSDWWGEYDCSSNRNMPKYIQWISRETQDPYNVSVYVDNYIRDWGFNDSKRDKIGWLLESPQMNEGTINFLVDNIDKTREHFKWIFTCMDSLLELGEPFVYNISNAVPWIWEKNRGIHPKTKLVSMIASNKGWLRGHQNRLQWVDKLKDKVDLFGSGRPNQLNDKEDGIRDYMFSVAIENDNSDTYFTEKLTDCFAMGTVPVYYGSRKVVEKYFDPTGVIFLEDDPNLESLTIEKYQSMMPAIERNLIAANNLPLAEDYMWENYLKNLF
jgi:Glycosyltransferase family 10 (fucosyltransferase) C-term